MSSLPDITNMVAVVTGGNSGFGKEVAKRLAARGATVVIAARREPEGQAVVQELQELGAKSALFVSTDIRSDASLSNLFAKVKEEYGKVTHVFINAGIIGGGGNYVDDETTDDIASIINTNITGTTLTARHAFRALKESDGDRAVVFTSSVGGSMANGLADILPAGDATFAVYASTKSYVDALARSSTAFYKQHGIRTYAISPSVYKTGMSPTDGSSDAISTIVNPNMKDYTGDAVDVAKVVEAMFDGTTKWKAGDNVGCEGPFTYNVEERYKLMYDPKHFGIASPPLPLEAFCNHSGEKVSIDEQDIQRIHDEYKESSQ